ncbi:MAG TPA: molecular chaperone HtpG, partial [Planctomycetes bacterium]|nr:molecular chaperone HtpG [Planctomycetota bacterium]
VVKKYSDFIEYPIRLVSEDEDGEEKTETLNSQKPIWTRPASEISTEEHAEFYRHLTHDWKEPLATIHFHAEGTSEYTALLYIPRERPLDLFDPSHAKSRVHLYVKRVFIMEDSEELLPVWLRFVRGVVDSQDLPLNVSRETLQHNRQMGRIQKRLTSKVLDTLSRLQRDDRDGYSSFWDAFGIVLKEGIYYDAERAEEIAKLALFETTHTPEAGDAEPGEGEPGQDTRTTLVEYVERMPVKQKEIYVLVADDLAHAKRSPHLEALRAKGFEVLLLTDPVDEFWLQRLTSFADHPIRRVDRGEVDLEDEADKEKRTEKEKEYESLLEAIRKELSEHVETVRFTGRLQQSPACLVDPENALPPQLRRMLREQGQSVPEDKRILELNPSHPLVKRLADLAADEAHYDRFAEACELLLGTALVTEGATPPDPARYGELVSKLLLA